MIRATAATWLSYATTLAFQILFASRFGSSSDAGAYVTAFAIAVSFGGLFVTTSLFNVLPRLVDAGGALLRPALRMLVTIAGLGSALAVGLAAAAPLVAGWVAGPIGVSTDLMTSLLKLAAIFMATLAISGVAGAVALARGHRFTPALAPAIPSTFGAVYLLLSGAPIVIEAMIATVLGGIVQLAFVGAVAILPRAHPSDGPPLRIGQIAAATIALLLLMGLLPPFQRVMATTLDPAGAVHFDYAIRAMVVGQLLLIGGIQVAILPDWSHLHRQLKDVRAVALRTVVLATLLLFGAGAIVLVAAPALVAILFERGEFDSSDTESVALLARLLIPGFIAEGVWMVLNQGMLATARTAVALRVWSVRLLMLLVFTVGLGAIWGAVGVAVAYSLSMFVTIAAGVFASFRVGIIGGDVGPLVRAFAGGLITLSVGALLTFSGIAIAPWAAAAAVIAAGIAAIYALDLHGLVLAAVRGASKVEADAG